MSTPTPHWPVAASEQHDPRARAVVVGRGTFATRFARLELAVASCRGRRHANNEDAHSVLDGPAPVYVVADGVGGGAMASRASRELVECVHRALDDGPIDESAVREALARRRSRSRAQHRERNRPARCGDGGAVRGHRSAAGELADRLGRRLPHLSDRRDATSASRSSLPATTATGTWPRRRRRAARSTILHA